MAGVNGTKLVMECKNQEEGKWSDVYAPIYRNDGSVSNTESKFDADDFRSLMDETKTRAYTNISGAIVDMVITSGSKVFPKKRVEVCAENQNYYVVYFEGVYYSVYKTATRFYLTEE